MNQDAVYLMLLSDNVNNADFSGFTELDGLVLLFGIIMLVIGYLLGKWTGK